jgi:hypothetical protein
VAPPLLAFLAGGAVVALAAWAGKREQRRRIAMLEALTARVGGHVEQEWFRTPRLVARVAGAGLTAAGAADKIRVEITLWSSKHGSFTEYWAHLPPPGSVEFKITPSHVGSRLTRLLGAQDVEIGHPEFDAIFVVKSPDEVTLRRLWTTDRARKMFLVFAGMPIDCDGQVLHMIEPRIESEEQIADGVEFLLDLARADPFGLRVLRRLPEATLVANARFPYAVVPGPQPIHVGPIARDGRSVTCARTAAVATGQPPPAAGALLAALGGGKLEITDAETRVCWPAIEDDPRRLVAAIELLRLLVTGPSMGVFR